MVFPKGISYHPNDIICDHDQINFLQKQGLYPYGRLGYRWWITPTIISGSLFELHSSSNRNLAFNTGYFWENYDIFCNKAKVLSLTMWSYLYEEDVVIEVVPGILLENYLYIIH